MSSAKELNDKKLEKVAGGITRNADGSYNLKKGETLVGRGGAIYSFTILQDYNNITINDLVYVESFTEMNNELVDNKVDYFTLGYIFMLTGADRNL